MILWILGQMKYLPKMTMGKCLMNTSYPESSVQCPISLSYKYTTNIYSLLT